MEKSAIKCHKVLNKKQEDCVRLLSQRDMNNEQIMEFLEIPRRTFYNWMKEEAFQARLTVLYAEYAEETRQLAIAVVEKRVRAQQGRYDHLGTVRRERAEQAASDPAMADVPGAKTGLLVQRTRVSGRGADAIITHDYELDKVLLSETRELELQTAKELGQHRERVELTGANGGAIQIRAEAVAGYWMGTIADVLEQFAAYIAEGRVVETVADAEALADEYLAAKGLLPSSEC